MLRSLRWIMAATPEVIQQLEQRAVLADQMINKLKNQLSGLKQASGPERVLAAENVKLLAEVKNLKRQLNILEARNGLIQVSAPITTSATPLPTTDGTKPDVAGSEPTPSQQTENKQKPAEGDQKDKKAKKEKKEKSGGKKAPPAANLVIDASLLDFRIGKIQAVKRHPDADTLYVEEIDCGEDNPRTVVSGLVKNIPIEEMQDKMVVLCCNLKPAKMRGILSQAMVMCASSPEKVELLEPPSGAVPGDRVSCEGYPLTEDFPAQMNPKKKIFEQIQPDLLTSAERVATYKGAPFKVEGKGVITAPTMANSGIK